MTHLALSPEFGLDTKAFAKIWNTLPECREAGAAEVVTTAPSQYEPLTTGGALISIGIGLVTAALYDLIKHALKHQGFDAASVEIVRIKQPDGTELLVVKRTPPR